ALARVRSSESGWSAGRSRLFPPFDGRSGLAGVAWAEHPLAGRSYILYLGTGSANQCARRAWICHEAVLWDKRKISGGLHIGHSRQRYLRPCYRAWVPLDAAQKNAWSVGNDYCCRWSCGLHVLGSTSTADSPCPGYLLVAICTIQRGSMGNPGG